MRALVPREIGNTEARGFCCVTSTTAERPYIVQGTVFDVMPSCPPDRTDAHQKARNKVKEFFQSRFVILMPAPDSGKCRGCVPCSRA